MSAAVQLQGRFPVLRPSGAQGSVPILLDTDIGTNVDDLLALIIAATAPEVSLVGVTTVYGDTTVRMKVAARVLQVLGCEEVPVAAGEERPHSGASVFWAGHEGEGYGDLDGGEGGGEGLPTASSLIGSRLEEWGTDLVILAIGPLTNVSSAVSRQQERGGPLPRCVVAMAGQFGEGPPDTNVRSDVVAAQQLASCGVPLVYVGIEACRRVPLARVDLEAAAPVSAGGDLAVLVRERTEAWWRHLGREESNPCDPLTLLALVEPEHFVFEAAEVSFEITGDQTGSTRWRRAEGPSSTWKVARLQEQVARQAVRRRLRDAVESGRTGKGRRGVGER